MIKTATAAFIAIATSLSFLFLSSPPKSTYHNLLLSISDNASISQHLFTLTRRPHVAGSQANAEAAAYVLSTLTSCNIRSHIASYDVLLTYPVSRSLTLTRPPPYPPIALDLQQKIYDGDPYADVANEVLPTFHGYAKSGTVSGPVVYVNYGRVEDYATLKEMGVNVSGAIALAKYGQIFRGDIVENAYDAGAVGVIIYTDRKDYGGGGGGAKWFPDDKWMPPSGVQVGSVFRGTGDPTTPGWPSSGACERLSDDEVEQRADVPHIPSLPVSWANSDAIMRSIGGPVANDDWQGGIDAPVYRVGPGPGILELSYTGKQVISTIENVIGIIEGAEEPDRFVILGNHRDAWTFGAVDPNSGTASMLEVAQRLGKLQKRGWKPRRTIVFCNWDAEEYGLIGSTEWVEENREMIASRVVAYLNVDSAVHEAGFHASATPQLDELLKQVAQQVQDPDNSSQTIYEAWFGSSNDSMIGRLGGGGSDYAAFVQHIGVPSADMSFGKGYPVYHSMYDDFVWMKKFGDPLFHRHVAVASIWGLVALRLADEEFLPFDYLSYAHELQGSAEGLKGEVSNKGISLIPLFKSIEELKKAATKINNQRKAMKGTKGWAMMWKKDTWKVRELNDRLMMAERAFTDSDGISRRPWHKHLGKQVISTIENVIGVIEGAEEPDRFVILGNHRDAWTFGAVDPNSGTASMLEVAQRLGKLQKRGWKPRRTIVFCNWDAEEYGLIGSTEWVEENREMIASRVVAYLNVDSAVYGEGFQASATPQLDELLKQATQKVQDPDNPSQTIYEAWFGSSNNSMIGRLGGGGSDYAAFVQHIGVPSADMSFGEGYPVYHSMYDDFIWMKKFGDPMFHRHVAVASIWGLVALQLADEEFLPFDYLSYAHELQGSAEELKGEVLNKHISLIPLFKSIEELKKAATKINNQRKAMKDNKGWSMMWKKDTWKVRELNDRLMMAERAFTDRDGLSRRPWYKHLIYAPSKHNDYGSKSFPGIDDSIEDAKSLNTAESWRFVQHEVWRVSRAITHASLVLNGELT